MTPRDFFIVVIRVLGLMWLGGFIFEVPVYVINIITTGFSQSSIVGLVVLVITSLMLFREVPNLCAWVFNYFQIKDFTHNMQKPDLSYLPKSAARIVLALLLFGERERIVKLLVKNEPKE